MAEEAINPLRRRMIEDMTILSFDQRTQQSYLRAVRSCCRCCERRPDQLTFEDASGNNKTADGVGYTAAKGWDACTGLGSPKGSALAALFTSTSPKA